MENLIYILAFAVVAAVFCKEFIAAYDAVITAIFWPDGVASHAGVLVGDGMPVSRKMRAEFAWRLYKERSLFMHHRVAKAAGVKPFFYLTPSLTLGAVVIGSMLAASVAPALAVATGVASAGVAFISTQARKARAVSNYHADQADEAFRLAVEMRADQAI